MRYYCGIDLHSKKSTFCVLDEEGKRVALTELRNDRERILDSLKPYGPDLCCVVESTYNWYWLVDALACEGYDVKLAHSYGLRLISGSKYKSDKRDAERLARLLRLGEIPEGYIYPKESRPARDLMRHRTSLVRQRASLRASVRITSSRYNLELKREELEGLDPASRVASLPLPAEVRQELAMKLERIDLLSCQIRRTEGFLVEEARPSPFFQALQAIPGVGHVLALTIYYEMADPARFPSARNFASYCRLVPSTAESAGKVKRGSGAKHGNPWLKWAFTQAAMGAARHHPGMRAFRDRRAAKRGGGRGANLVANSILAHRLACAVWHMAVEGVVFEEERITGGGHAVRLTEQNS
ncbi:MAG: IS110 family transposase [Methanomassiliicoccales archaeon]|nr:IS110 family transposase [Methanomassiliicoccales archaeon]